MLPRSADQDRSIVTRQSDGASDGAGGQEERRVVTVLFADLEGYTTLAERLDPEDLRAVQAAYFDLVTRIVHRRFGVVEKYVGDAVMAVFGAPTARESDALCAVKAGMEIQESLAGRRLGPIDRVRARVAVASGEAVVDLAAVRDSGQALVSGEVVSTAARLQQHAPAGEVLVTEDVQESCGESVEFADVGSAVLRGRTAPVRYARAVRLLRRRRWDLRPDEGSLIGRADELEQLLRAVVDSAQHRMPVRVTLTGQAGVGKSRLLRELYRRVDGLNSITVTWRTGQCPRPGEGGPYDALSEIIAEQARITDTADAPAIRAALRTMADQLLPAGQRSRLVDACAALLGGTGERLTAAEAESSWRSLLLAMARQQPTLLSIEDAHWSHDVLLTFLDRLISEAAGLPLVVLVTGRLELLEVYPRGQQRTAPGLVRLEPLSDGETITLLKSLFSQAEPDDTTLRALLPVAAGNPLYAHEYARMIVDRGEMQGSGAALDPVAMIRDTLARDALPGSIRAVIYSRLDLLAAETRTVLGAAAAIGETFWPAAISAVTGLPHELTENTLETLVGKELLRRVGTSSIPGEPEFTFRHVLVREMAYRRLPRHRRSTVHNRAARWLEARPDRIREALAERLANHRTVSLDLARGLGRDTPDMVSATRRALVAAARRARQQHAAAAALGHLDRALVLWPDRPTGDELADRLDAEVLRSEMRFLLDPRRFRANAGPAELTAAAANLDRLGRAESAAYALTLLGHTYWTGGDLSKGRAALSRALELFNLLPDSESAAAAYAEMARLALAESDLATAVNTAGRAAAIAADLGLLELAASSRISAGAARYMMGRDEAIAELTEAVEFSRSNGVYALRRAEYVMGVVLQEDGDLGRGLALIDNSRQVGGEGTSATLADVSHEAERAYYAGDLPRLLRAADQYLSGVPDGDVDLEALQLQALCAWVRVVRGEPPGVDLDALLDVARRGGARLAVTRTLAHGALSRALAGDLDGARRWLDQLVEDGAAAMFLSRDWLPATAHAVALAGEPWGTWLTAVLAEEPRRSMWVRAARQVAAAGVAAERGDGAEASARWAAATDTYDRIGAATEAALAATMAVATGNRGHSLVIPLAARVRQFAAATGAHRLLVIAGLAAGRDQKGTATRAAPIG